MYQWRHNRRGRVRILSLSNENNRVWIWVPDANGASTIVTTIMKNVNSMVGQWKKVTAAIFFRCPTENINMPEKHAHHMLRHISAKSIMLNMF